MRELHIWFTSAIRTLLFGASALLALGLVTAQAGAEERSDHGEHHVVRWTTADGLPSNIIRALAQTPDGYLWVGTWAGLARFDGVHFETFDLTNAPELGGLAITCLAVDSDGTLWIGMHGGTVSRYRDGRFERVPPRLESGLMDLCVDPEGGVWAGGHGLARCDGDEFRPVLDIDVVDMHCGSDGTLWIGNAAGVWQVRDESLVPRPSTDSHVRGVRGLSQLPDGDILAHSMHQLVRYPEGRVLASSPSGSDSGVQGWDLWGSEFDAAGNCWWACASGLYRLSSAVLTQASIDWSARLRVLPLEFTGPARAVMQDGEGHVFVGTEGRGLLLVEPRHVRRLEGNVKSVAPLADGSVWVTAGGVPVHRSKDGVTLETLDEFAHAHVSCAQGDGIWIAHPDGYARLRQGQLDRFDLPPGVGRPLRPLFEDADGALWWHGARQALSRIQEGQVTHRLQGVIRGVGHDGTLLVVHRDQGLGRLRDGQFEPVYTGGLGGISVHEDDEGRLWLGTKGRGLLCVEGRRVSALTKAHGLPHNVIGSIVQDDRRRLWINSNAGVFVMKIDDLLAVIEGRWDHAHYRLVSWAEMGHRSSVLAPDGSLYASTIEGFERIDARALSPLPPPARTLIQHVLVGDRRYPAALRIELPPGVRSADIVYTSPSLGAGRWLHFRHRLDGVDATWVLAGERRIARYADLPPGEHTFRVEARYPGGEWDESSSIRLFVPARLHEALWFRGLLGLALAGVAFSLYRARRRTVRSEQEALVSELERHRSEERARGLARRLVSAQEDERRRIARELHDDINQRLAVLSLGLEGRPGEIAEHLQTVRELSRDVHRLSHDLHPARLEQFGISTGLRGLVRKAQTPGSVEVVFETSGDTKGLDEVAALCLYRITQEALANLLRHSEASHAKLRLERAGAQVRLTIEDDGVGFDPVTVRGEGLGLPGMAERAEVAGGTFEIRSVPGEGTQIEVLLPYERRRS